MLSNFLRSKILFGLSGRDCLLLLAGLIIFALSFYWFAEQEERTFKRLTDPFLQRPTKDSVNVVWFTEGKGKNHYVLFGESLEQKAIAKSAPLSRVRDGQSKNFQRRNIWRHEAIVPGLAPGKRVDYASVSEDDEGKSLRSKTYSLAPLPETGSAVKILLTSDHQLKSMTPANLQKVVETVGQVDAVFFAGDLVNIPDNAEEWFDHPKGNSFFAALQGRTREYNPTHPYKGGAILQYAPIFPSIGNHEVMGRFDGKRAHYGKERPRWFAQLEYDREFGDEAKDVLRKTRDSWIEDHSFNAKTYKEIFSLPGNEDYYDLLFGNVYLASLYATRPWRPAKISKSKSGKYHEASNSLANPRNWSFGDFLFERIDSDSEQFKWLASSLQTDAAAQAEFRLIMAHQVSRGLGGNAMPLMSDQIATISYKAKDGKKRSQFFNFPPTAETWRSKIRPILTTATTLRYDYPKTLDHWKNAIEPLLERNNVNLVFHGHSHLWYRLQTKTGLRYLETSNVGNSYGGYLRGIKYRQYTAPADPQYYNMSNYSSFGDPYDGEIQSPTLFSPQKHEGQNLPFVASNKLTVFSIFDSGTGLISSYVFDTTQPNSDVKKFDEFSIK